MNILILGGTGEARLVAQRLVGLGHEVTTSLAGRTSSPLAPPGNLRIGGFGGAQGLANYLAEHRIDRLVDATHPYAARISANAISAAAQTGLPLVRLLRAPWPEPQDCPWRHASNVQAAARTMPHGGTVLVTSGHNGLEAFHERADCRQIVRLIEPPAEPLPWFMTLLLDRPPYTFEGECALLAAHRVTHLVSKNSGGSQTSAKLLAARAMGVEIIMIDRPAYDLAPEADSVEGAIALLGL